MKIFLTGASGLVGSCFAQMAASAGHHVVGTTGGSSLRIAGVTTQVKLNLADLREVDRAVLEARPDAIVNAAAISEPYKCDADPVHSTAINVQLPEHLAMLAGRNGARFIHLSSEQAFDGTRPPYRTTDAVSPINEYARQKVESERRVQTAAPRNSATVRAPLLMGNSAGEKRSVHERLFAEWAAGKTPKLFADEFRQTCTAENLSAALLELCERRDLIGLFHWAGAELTSRYDQGVRIRSHFQLPEERAPIQRVTRAELPEMARARQANLQLDLEPLRSALRTRAQTFDEQLATCRVPSWAADWHRANRAIS
jgi:dTDP-4-dehydrorhamnose reductase